MSPIKTAVDASSISTNASRRVLLPALHLDVQAMLMALPRLELRILRVAHLTRSDLSSLRENDLRSSAVDGGRET
jgi:hypothetical protein